MQTLRQFMKEVFRRADSSRYTSIAIPAIGTGNLHIPHALVAKWMYDEVQEFGQKNPNTSLRDIRFVVYDKDAQTVAVISVAVSIFFWTRSLWQLCENNSNALGGCCMCCEVLMYEQDGQQQSMSLKCPKYSVRFFSRINVKHLDNGSLYSDYYWPA